MRAIYIFIIILLLVPSVGRASLNIPYELSSFLSLLLGILFSAIVINIIWWSICKKQKIKSEELLALRTNELMSLNHELSSRNEEINQQKEQLTETLNALQKSEEKVLAIFDSTVISIGIFDHQGGFTFANSTFSEMFNFSDDDLYPLHHEDIIYPKDLHQYKNYYDDLLTGKSQNYHIEIRFIRKDGTFFWADYSASLIHDNDGKIEFIIGIIVDISDRKLTEKKLREANAAKDKFFSIIAHDIKNPLTALIFSSEVLSNYYDKFSEEKKKRAIQNIYRSGRHLEKLLENLLQWARCQTGRLEFQPHPIDFYVIVDNVLSLMEPNAKSKHISLIHQIEESTIVFADENMLRTIIRNLISNAIKFSKDGGQIQVLCQNFVSYLEISIIDNGIGMSDEDVEKLFKIDKAFTRYGTNNESGTGLGLILCKEFVERHGGEIWIESEIDNGSTFKFTLPQNQ